MPTALPNYRQAAQEWKQQSVLIRPVSDAIVSRLPALPADARVLDLGCGVGEPGLSVKARQPHTRLLGIDSEPAMVDAARDRAGDVQGASFQVMSMESLTLDTASIDALVSRWAFLNVTDTAVEAARVLRPGGAYAFTVWDQSELNTPIHAFHQILLGHTGSETLPDPRIFTTLAADDRRERWLRDAGMSTVESELIHWVFTLPNREALLENLTEPPFGATVAALDAPERADVEQEVTDWFARYRDTDGGYRIPRTCRLYWGHR
jgi:ubiquinone/menaquinone biosynthesis C-methylase UbiE